jgi:hypothetical protein
MKIAVIAWGSLIWDPRELQVVGAFKPNGPILPLEFARISKDGRLTLAFTKKYGTPCKTYSARSKFNAIGDAVDNLYLRETGKPLNMAEFSKNNNKYPEAVSWYIRGSKCPNEAQYKTMKAWLEQRNMSDYDAVIWTSLKMKFYDKAKTTFSPKNAIRYLRKLTPEERARAIEYIDNAPPEIRTHVRALSNLYSHIGMLD